MTDRYGVSARYPTYFNGDTISGTVEININSNSLKHKGIKAEIHGIVEKYGTLNTTNSFLFLTSDLMSAGEIIQEKITLDFNFRNPYLKYGSYKGKYASVKYFVKIIIDSILVNSTYEKEFAVVNPSDESILYENDLPLNLRVGVKNILSLSIEFEHSNYNCRGILKGFVIFNLVNINIKSMEIQLLRKEVVFGEKNCEPEFISRYELIDGGPIEHEKIPIRFFLKSYNLTPSYFNVEGIFGVKYFLNLIVIDCNNNRYYKSAEINLYRIFRDRRAHMHNFDNNGLFISEPFFEEDYYYERNNINNGKNNNNNYNYNYDDGFRDNNYKRDNYNENNQNRLENNDINFFLKDSPEICNSNYNYFYDNKMNCNNDGIINYIGNNNNFNRNKRNNLFDNNRRFNRKEYRNNNQNNEDRNNYNYYHKNMNNNSNRLNTYNTDNNSNRNINNKNSNNNFIRNITFNEECHSNNNNIDNMNNLLWNNNHKKKVLNQKDENNIKRNPFYKFHNNTNNRNLFGNDEDINKKLKNNNNIFFDNNNNDNKINISNIYNNYNKK